MPIARAASIVSSGFGNWRAITTNTRNHSAWWWRQLMRDMPHSRSLPRQDVGLIWTNNPNYVNTALKPSQVAREPKCFPRERSLRTNDNCQLSMGHAIKLFWQFFASDVLFKLRLLKVWDARYNTWSENTTSGWRLWIRISLKSTDRLSSQKPRN